MSKKKRNVNVRVIRPMKSDVPTQVVPEEVYAANEWITAPVELMGYRQLVDDSTILPQCIRAYRHNIAGFGVGVRYVDDQDGQEETPEMRAEFDRMTEVIETLTLDMDTKELFEDLIEARETYGIGYLEVIRDADGNVSQLEFIHDTPSIEKTKPMEPYQDTEYFHHGRILKRKKKFRKYRQVIGNKCVYYKEFGDPRIMDKTTGEYLKEKAKLEIGKQANEIIEYAIGTAPYGLVRWIGQILSVDGCRRAENLNNNYFRKGRHTPLAIIVENGTLSDESYQKLQEYMNNIEGENGQHSFLLLEMESTVDKAAFESEEKPHVVLKDLGSILQKDELFQDYMDNTRRKVQSAFQLPDLYVAYTTDFNRATAQTAQEITEQQVFQPERESLAWFLNNRILNGYQFKYVEAYFKTPNISNPEDLYKLMTIANAAGGLTPNKSKELLYESLGETSEDYEGDWGNIPMALISRMTGTQMPAGQVESLEAPAAPGAQQDDVTKDPMDSLNKMVAKAAADHEDQILSVLKEVRRQLEEAVVYEDNAEEKRM